MPALFQCRLPLIHSVCVKVRRFPGKSMRPVGACVCALYRGSGYGNWERRREGDDAVHWRASSISCAWMRLIGEREKERYILFFVQHTARLLSPSLPPPSVLSSPPNRSGNNRCTTVTVNAELAPGLA